MTRFAAAGMLVAILTGCSAGADRDPQPAKPEPAVTAMKTSGTLRNPPPSPTNSATVVDDACGASKVEPWLGRESTIPVRRAVVEAAGPVSDRWIYPDSVVTQDRRDDRLNVVMEKGTNIIVSAHCG